MDRRTFLKAAAGGLLLPATGIVPIGSLEPIRRYWPGWSAPDHQLLGPGVLFVQNGGDGEADFTKTPMSLQFILSTGELATVRVAGGDRVSGVWQFAAASPRDVAMLKRVGFDPSNVTLLIR